MLANRLLRMSPGDRNVLIANIINGTFICFLWTGLWIMGDPSNCTKKVIEYQHQCIMAAQASHMTLISLPLAVGVLVYKMFLYNPKPSSTKSQGGKEE